MCSFFVECKVCGKQLRKIMHSHLKVHGINSVRDYLEQYPGAETTCKETREAISRSKAVKIQSPKKSTSTEHNFHVQITRKNQRIKYEEFLTLINQGLSITQMISSGISKHQLAAFSALAQGKISITKEQFQNAYLEGKSMEEIANIYNVSRDHLTQIREHFGIKRLGRSFIERKKTERPLTFRQEKIIYGTLMGDGTYSGAAGLKCKQSIKQKKYLIWKYDELKEHVTDIGIREETVFDARFNEWYTSFSFHLQANTWIETIINQFYYSGKKYITQQILNKLDELSMAVWIMDDGKTNWYTNTAYNNKPVITICTDSFTLNECEIIAENFNKWNLSPKVTTAYRQDQYRITFNTTDTENLISIIKPYIPPCMQYKVDYDAYMAYRITKNSSVDS